AKEAKTNPTITAAAIECFTPETYTRSPWNFQQLSKSGDSAQNADQAAPSLRNWAKERIAFIFSSRNPRRSSSPSRFSNKSLPNTSVSRELRKSYLRSISLRRSVRECFRSHQYDDHLFLLVFLVSF